MHAWKVPLLSAVVLSVLWLLSPGRSSRAPEPGVVEITFVGPGGPISGATDDAVREFEAESRRAHAADPKKPVYRVVSGQDASRDQTQDPTRFLVSVAGGVPPDVIRFDRYAVAEWASRRAFLDLSPFLARDAAENRPDAMRAEEFYPSCWKEVVFTDPATGRGGVYGIPSDVDTRALFYNADLLKRAGFVDERGEARPPRTWEELADMAVALTERDANGRITRLGFAPNYGDAWLTMYGYSNGGEFVSADGRRCTLDNPRVVQALEWVVSVYDRLGGATAVQAFEAGSKRRDALDPFVAGQVAMKIDGSWQVPEVLALHGADLSYAMVPPPLPAARAAEGRPALSWTSGWCYAVPSTARHPDAAWELIRFLSSRRAAELIAESSRLTEESQGRLYVPLQHSRASINEALFKTYVYDNPAATPKLKAAARVFQDLIGASPFRPVSPVGQLIFNEQGVAMEKAMRHQASPAESLAVATRNCQRQLDRVLQPARGPVLPLGAVVVGYLVLLTAGAFAIYRWDTGRGGLEGASGAGGAYFRSQWAGGIVCALPWIVGFVVFTGGPIVFSVVLSFCDYDILNPARLIGTGNYEWMVTKDPLFWKALGNTLYMVAGIPLGMAISLGIALLLNLEIRGIAVWRTFFYLPSIVPAVASSILWIWIFNPNAGLLNGLLASFGIHGPNWLLDERTAKPALILMGLWGAGGGMVIWLAGLKSISTSYYEAAAIDGASTLRRFWNITLPLLSPYIFFNLIMGLIGTFQIFTQAFIMTQGGPVNSTLFFAYHLFNQAFRYLEMGYAAALGWVLFLIVFALTMLQMKMSDRWVHYEAD